MKIENAHQSNLRLVNYRGIKLMPRIMKVSERILERNYGRRQGWESSSSSLDFRRRETMDAIRILRLLFEKY